MQTTYFNNFSISLPEQAILECSAVGSVDDAVKYWAMRTVRPITITEELLRKELTDWGAWTEEELEDDFKNWQRIVWIAANNLKDAEENI